MQSASMLWRCIHPWGLENCFELFLPCFFEAVLKLLLMIHNACPTGTGAMGRNGAVVVSATRPPTCYITPPHPRSPDRPARCDTAVRWRLQRSLPSPPKGKSPLTFPILPKLRHLLTLLNRLHVCRCASRAKTCHPAEPQDVLLDFTPPLPP